MLGEPRGTPAQTEADQAVIELPQTALCGLGRMKYTRLNMVLNVCWDMCRCVIVIFLIMYDWIV